MAKPKITSEKPRQSKKKKVFTEIKCTICKKTFTEKAGLAQHIQTHSDEKPFACHLCPHTCKTKKYLSRHIRKVHTQPKGHECSFCGRKFHYDCLLKKHMYTHTDERPYKCTYCGKGFNSTYSLNTHKYIHADLKPFKCEFCDYACRDSSTLRKHTERHMGIKCMYMCKICDKSYRSKTLLKLHVTEVHLDIDVKNKECEKCGKLFKTLKSLNNHIKIVHKRANACNCEVCGMRLSNKYNLAAHVARHLDFKPYRCNFRGCNKKFKEKCYLKKHLIIHYPNRHWECKLCDRKFSRLHRYNLHKKQHSLKEKCVVCDYCGISFYNKNYLRYHITNKHMLTKKYICDVCGLCAYNRSSIARHIKEHDVRLDRKCKMCKKTFKKLAYLKSHYWTTHSVRYKLITRKPRIKSCDSIKEEPKDYPEIELSHEVKLEHHSDQEESTRDQITINGQTPMQFEDFYTKHIIRPSTSKIQELEEDEDIDIDLKIQKEAKKCLEQTFEEIKKKKEMKYLEKIRREYNKRMRCANLKQLSDKSKVKIVKANFKSNGKNNDNNVNSNDEDDRELVIDLDDKETENNDDNETTKTNNDEENEDGETEKTNDDDDNATTNTNNDEVNEDGETLKTNDNDDEDDEILKTNNDKIKQDSKLTINMHQCYVCFKLFETKEKLINHCHEHFDVCNISMLKKCPLCDFVTKASLTRHMLNIHKVHIRTQYGTLKNKTDGTTYYYNVKNKKIKQIEVIPSVKNLNKCACVKLDKRKRELNEKNLTKTKLVKKNGEWIVEKEKIDAINKYIIPKIKTTHTLIESSDDYVGRLKKLYQVAKKEGQKMLFPCEHCDKICQTLSALKLHTRKHQENPKPFKKKVWKHKTVKIVNTVIEKPTPISKNRYEKPKPIVNKHKCDEKLKQFYENNIKGGDVEFWQFLKIFNKMSRENINDFSDLETRTDFGIHFSLPVKEETEIAKPVENKRKRNRKYVFTRKILISRKEYKKRKKIIESLRRNISLKDVNPNSAME